MPDLRVINNICPSDSADTLPLAYGCLSRPLPLSGFFPRPRRHRLGLSGTPCLFNLSMTSALDGRFSPTRSSFAFDGVCSCISM
jgi:hypothetical protein